MSSRRNFRSPDIELRSSGKCFLLQTVICLYLLEELNSRVKLNQILTSNEWIPQFLHTPLYPLDTAKVLINGFPTKSTGHV